MTDPKDGGAAFPTNDLTAIRAQMKALEGFTPGPWATECDDCHFGSLSSVRGGGAAQKQGLHRELMVEVGGWQGVKAQEATTRLIAVAPDMRDTLLALCDEVDRLRGRIENAGQAASETHPSWERRCYAITAALGFDYGEPTPDIPEQSGWYARKMKQMEDENFRLIAKNERMREALTFYTVPGNWCIGGPLDGNSGNYTGGPARAALGQEGDV